MFQLKIHEIIYVCICMYVIIYIYIPYISGINKKYYEYVAHENIILYNYIIPGGLTIITLIISIV